MSILADLQTAAARKWTSDPACQQAGLFWRAAVELERLTDENANLRDACAAGWGEPTLVNTLRDENQTLRAEKEWLYAENQRLRACVRTARADEAHCWARRADGLTQTLHDEMDENLRLRELGGAKPDETIGAFTERLIRERDALRADLDDERMRNVACAVVAGANTPESAAQQRQMLPIYQSVAVVAVMEAVDREMAHRLDAERLRAELHREHADHKQTLADVDTLVAAERTRIDAAPVAIIDTRDVLGLCAPTEAGFAALYALQGHRVALVDLGLAKEAP